MSIFNVLSLIGGLALFLFGMNVMGEALEKRAGSSLKGILEKLTASRFKGFLLGAAVTAVIQSSSATTVMVVGFVNSGIMNLKQAIGIIMGANVGTGSAKRPCRRDSGWKRRSSRWEKVLKIDGPKGTKMPVHRHSSARADRPWWRSSRSCRVCSPRSCSSRRIRQAKLAETFYRWASENHHPVKSDCSYMTAWMKRKKIEM